MRRKSDAEYLVDEHGCWIWQLSRNTGGYGPMWSKADRRLLLAHRVFYTRAYGPIPNGFQIGFQIDHTCQVRACVNPRHLEAVTVKATANGPAGEGAGDHHRPARRRSCVRSIQPTACSGPAASIGTAREHCKHGHEYTQENTIWQKDGRRKCRVCRTEMYARSEQRRRDRRQRARDGRDGAPP